MILLVCEPIYECRYPISTLSEQIDIETLKPLHFSDQRSFFCDANNFPGMGPNQIEVFFFKKDDILTVECFSPDKSGALWADLVTYL